MRAWSPILIRKIEIQALGFVLRKLQLNRHREAEVAPHQHDCTQLILYLSGAGRQSVGSRRRIARAGDLFVIPPGTPHGFALMGKNRPVCLVLDYEVAGSGRLRTSYRRVPTRTLNEIHSLLARVPAKGRLTLADFPGILAVVACLLEPPPAAADLSRKTSVFDQVRPLLRATGGTPLAEVARRAGFHPDHLTRKLKAEAGLGLRDLRDRMRLEAAHAALRSSSSVAEAASQSGFDDPNYFARWFRQRTGYTPSTWRRRTLTPNRKGPAALPT